MELYLMESSEVIFLSSCWPLRGKTQTSCDDKESTVTQMFCRCNSWRFKVTSLWGAPSMTRTMT